MRILFIVGLLLQILGPTVACGPAAPGGGTPRTGPPAAAAIPNKIDADNYKVQREIYDSLSVGTRGREAFRALLLAHKMSETERLIARGKEARALGGFKAIITLFDPTEVYQGQILQPAIFRLSQKIIDTYSPRGDETNVLLPLLVQMSLSPGRKDLSEKLARILGWLREADRLTRGESRQWNRVILALEKSVALWPSVFAVEQLRKLYIEQKLTVARSVHVSPYRHLRSAVSALFQTGFKVARMYLRVNLPDEALKRLQEVSTDGAAQDEELRLLLEQATSKKSAAADHIRLAEHFESRDREVALRICRTALTRFPEQAKVSWCVGRIAAALERGYLSVLNLRHAVKLEPENRTFAVKLAEQYQQKVFRLISQEKLDKATRELVRIEQFYDRAKKNLGAPLSPPLSRVHYAIGHGLYNSGRVGLAAKAFEKSIASKISPEALVQLGSITLKRGDAKSTHGIISRVEQLPMPSARARTYWRGRIEGMRGQAHGLKRQDTTSQTAHKRSVAAWQQLQVMGLEPDDRAEAYIYEARSLYALNEKARAMDALDRAIDVQPDRKETYADVIALLTTHGHLPEALDAYHRALGRHEVSEYLKTYCSFWIIGLARRAKQPPDPLAIAHLKAVSSSAWYNELSKFFLGKLSFDGLLARAKTPGNLAETYFYQADLLVSQGKIPQAQELWKKVLKTNMMAFYEYDMAIHYLRHGPAKVSVRPLDRKQTGLRDRRSQR